MRRRALALAGLALLPVACSSAGGRSPSYGAAPRLDEGAVALARADFPAAKERLTQTRQTCGNALLGRQALLLLGALELDPRNPDRDPDRSAELTGRYLRLPETFPWTRPLAEALYLLALDLGAAIPEDEGRTDPDGPFPAAGLPPACEVGDRQVVQAATAELPTLTGASVPNQLRALERQRAAQRRELAALEAEVARLETELQRVRATVRP
ncbi:MAG TPA: hypothetical protein VM737_11695 [Gemmatimonadota bacterium]|nr:hypothetical protein [Gemmatimonadota bacterium]